MRVILCWAIKVPTATPMSRFVRRPRSRFFAFSRFTPAATSAAAWVANNNPVCTAVSSNAATRLAYTFRPATNEGI